jgi:hypothetical protein
MLTVGGWSGSSTFTTLVASDDSISAFVDTLSTAVTTYGFDGIDIDWEYPGAAGDTDDVSLFVLFVLHLAFPLEVRDVSPAHTLPALLTCSSSCSTPPTTSPTSSPSLPPCEPQSAATFSSPPIRLRTHGSTRRAQPRPMSALSPTCASLFSIHLPLPVFTLLTPFAVAPNHLPMSTQTRLHSYHDL